MDKFINLVKNYLFSRTWISAPIDREAEKLFDDIAQDSARIEQLALMLKNGYVPTPSNVAHAGRLISLANFDKDNFFMGMTNTMSKILIGAAGAGKVITETMQSSSRSGKTTTTTTRATVNRLGNKDSMIALGLSLGGGILDNLFGPIPKSQTNSDELKENLKELSSLMLASMQKGYAIGMKYESNTSVNYLRPGSSLETDLNTVMCLAAMGDKLKEYLKNMELSQRLTHIHRYRQAQTALEPYQQTLGVLLEVHTSEELDEYENGFFKDKNNNLENTPKQNGLSKIQQMATNIAMTNPGQVGVIECLELEQKILYIQTQYASELNMNIEDRVFLQTLLSEDIPSLLSDSVTVSSPAMQRWAQIQGGNLSQDVRELALQYKEIVDQVELKYTAINAQNTSNNLQAKRGYLRSKQKDMGLKNQP